jgi:hypothetical protein
MLMLTRRVGGAGRMHHLVLWRSTTRWDCNGLPLLTLLVSTDSVVRYDGIAVKLMECDTSVERHTLLELSG